MTKNVSVPEGYKKTELGVVPEEWVVAKLSNVCSEVLSGGTPSTSKISYWGGNIPWMTSSNISNMYVINGQKYITEEGLNNSASKVVPKNNIIVATRVGLGKVAINLIDISISQDLTGLIINKKKADYIFLYWILKLYESKIIAYAQGTTIKGILKADLLNIKLSLPPLPEQQKIATILSKVDEQIEQTEQIIEKTEILKKGLMQKLLTKGIGHTKFKKTELGEIPEEWEIKGLTKVFNTIDYRGRTPPFSENGIPYIGADSIKDARIVFNKRRYVSEETYTEYMTRGIPNPDDIFFTTEAPLGNVAQVPEYKFCFAQRVVVFQCKNDFSPLFFMYLLKTKIMQKQFLDWATGTTVTGISSKNMKFIKLYYPESIQEQKKIGQVLESVDKYIDSEKENLLSLQELKKGLMQDLLTGKVRVCV